MHVRIINMHDDYIYPKHMPSLRFSNVWPIMLRNYAMFNDPIKTSGRVYRHFLNAINTILYRQLRYCLMIRIVPNHMQPAAPLNSPDDSKEDTSS
jgi:hypothetical protein